MISSQCDNIIAIRKDNESGGSLVLGFLEVHKIDLTVYSVKTELLCIGLVHDRSWITCPFLVNFQDNRQEHICMYMHIIVGAMNLYSSHDQLFNYYPCLGNSLIISAKLNAFS